MAFDTTDTTAGQEGGDEGNLLWDIFKVVAFVIGAIVIVRILFGLLVGLIGFVASIALPLLVVSILAFIGYKMFLEDDSSQTAQSDPALLEHQTTSNDEVLADDILLDEDPLEKEFEELEAQHRSEQP